MGDISSLVLRVDSSGVGKASEDLDGFSKSADRSASAATGFAESTVSINTGTLKAAAGTTALTLAVKKLVSSLGEAGMSALKMYSHFEQMENGLATVFQSAEKGKAVFEDLRAFSFKTTFGVDELADAATQLYNIGMAEDEVKGKLAMLGDLAGGQKQKFAELVSIYGKIVSTGQASSMQMQQLALRGIPINQVLKEMGVVGTASAEQITAAFEKLTGEGGRFHDAMNSIIDTIEGKEGFLSDTLNEMGVNFAEASGLADAYKDGLDVLYGGVQAVTDKLADIGENPTYKLLFQGGLAAIIGGVGVALTTALVPALGAVAAKMGIIATLSAIANPAALIGGAVAGVGLLALSKEVEHSKELTKEVDGLVEKRQELQKLQDDGTATFEEQIELQRTQVALAEEMVRRREEEAYLYGGDEEYYAEARRDLEVEEQKLAAMIEQKRTMDEALRIYRIMASQAQQVKAIEAERVKEQNDFLENNRKIYEQTYEGRKESLQAQIQKEKIFLSKDHPTVDTGETRTGYVAGVKFEEPIYRFATEKEIAEAKAALEDYEKRLKELEKNHYIELHPKIKEPEKSEFEKALEQAQKAFDDVQINVALGLTGSGDLDEAKLAVLKAQLRKAYDDAGLTQMDVNTAEFAEAIAKFNELNAATIENIDSAERLVDVYGHMADQLEEVFRKAGMSAEASKILAHGITDILKQEVSSAMINGFQAIGEALGTGASSGAAMKQVMLDFVKQTLSQTSALAINAGLAMLSTGPSGIPMALALFALGGVAGIGAGVLGSKSSGSDYEQKEKEQLELMKAINEQYKSLYSAMKDQEEYYLQKQRQITSVGINEGAGLTQVNDMILTPQGNFSTSPKDYLIATKNPGSLFEGSGETKISVVINNSMGDSANVTTQSRVGPEGQQELVVAISKKIAQDYASGMNGWDYAIDANSSRRRGRSLG